MSNTFNEYEMNNAYLSIKTAPENISIKFICLNKSEVEFFMNFCSVDSTVIKSFHSKLN